MSPLVSSLLVAPGEGYLPDSEDFAYAARELACVLPTEYVAFATRYGAGTCFDCLTVLVPMRPRPQFSWSEELVGSVPFTQEEICERREIVRLPTRATNAAGLPRDESLLPFARTDYGHIFYWQRRDNALDPAVYCGPSRMSAEHRVCDSFYAFTEGLVAGAFVRGLGLAPCAPRFVPSPCHG
jgi:hypothetical protein